MRRLPRLRFKGTLYTIDARLKEFRNLKKQDLVPFRSPKGDHMLSLAIKRNKFNKEELKSLF